MTAKRKTLLFLLGAIIVPIAGLYTYLALSNNPLQFWKKVSRVQVNIDGQRTETQVYRRPSGKLLIDFGKDERAYVYFPEVNNVGLCNHIKGVAIPAYIYAKDYDDESCPCVLMGTAKTEVDARVVMQPNRLGFTTIDARRVEISW
jgi:hypothetical protein